MAGPSVVRRKERIKIPEMSHDYLGSATIDLTIELPCQEAKTEAVKRGGKNSELPNRGPPPFACGQRHAVGEFIRRHLTEKGMIRYRTDAKLAGWEFAIVAVEDSKAAIIVDRDGAADVQNVDHETGRAATQVGFVDFRKFSMVRSALAYGTWFAPFGRPASGKTVA